MTDHAQPGERTEGAKPGVSVIIPVYDDAQRLRTCLAALHRQDYGGPVEIIVVDNGSSGGLQELHREFPDCRWLYEPVPGSYRARNRGLSRARHPIIAFTDSDCLPAHDWLACGVDAIGSDAGIGLVGGRVELFARRPESPRIAELYEIVLGFPQREYIRSGFSATANMMTRRDIFDRVGHFGEGLLSGGDAEWGRRVRRAEYRLVYEDRMIVRHPARPDMKTINRRLRRIMGGIRDINPSWRDAVRVAWLNVKSIRKDVAAIRAHPGLGPFVKMRLTWLTLGVRLRRAWYRLSLQISNEKSPRS
jgi:GT2 family glycosyltransferase